MKIWISSLTKQSQDVYLKKGLAFHVEKGVDPEVRRAVLEFARWLRSEYIFPARVNVYIKCAVRIRASNGEMVCDTCWRPGDKRCYPYIRISTGDYGDMVSERGKDNALASILFSIARMLTHYYQWVKDLDNLTEKQEEQQAQRCANTVMYKYAQTRDHP